MRVKYMNKSQAETYRLWQFPNFSATGNIKGMKEKYYGKDALLVRSNGYIYNVPPEIYDCAY